MEIQNHPTPPKRPIPQRPQTNLEEKVQTQVETKTLPPKEVQQNQTTKSDKKSANQKEILFGVLGGVCLVLAVVFFILMLVI